MMVACRELARGLILVSALYAAISVTAVLLLGLVLFMFSVLCLGYFRVRGSSSGSLAGAAELAPWSRPASSGHPSLWIWRRRLVHEIAYELAMRPQRFTCTALM